MAQQPQTPTNKPIWKRWYFWVGIVLILGLIGGIMQALGIDPDTTAEPAETATSEPTTGAAPEPTETEEPEPTETEPSGPPLSERVEAALYEGNAKCDGSGLITDFRELCTTSPGFYIASIEDEGEGAIRVKFQLQMEKEDREASARWVMQLACPKVDDLDRVIGVDLEGYEQYWDRSDSPICS